MKKTIFLLFIGLVLWAQNPVVRTGGSLTTDNVACGAGGQTVADCGYAKTAVQLTTLPMRLTFTVGTGGVVANTPVKWAGGLVVAVTGAEGALGIAESTVSAAGTVVVDLLGASHCIASGAITADHYLSFSGGVCTDTSQTARSAILTSVNLLGKADANYTSGQTVTVDLIGPYSGGSAELHVFTFSIDNGSSVIPTGDVGWSPTSAFACTIFRTDISGSPSGSITVDIWKAAGAIPTVSDKISASAPVTLSSATLNQNGALTSWTTAVAAGDVLKANVASATTVTKALVQIWCK